MHDNAVHLKHWYVMDGLSPSYKGTDIVKNSGTYGKSDSVNTNLGYQSDNLPENDVSVAALSDIQNKQSEPKKKVSKY